MQINVFEKKNISLTLSLIAGFVFLLMPAKGLSQEDDLADSDELGISSEICSDFSFPQYSSNNNAISISQMGGSNSITSFQQGSHNVIIADQSGYDNSVTILQNGEGNTSVISQNGTGNFIDAVQNNEGNLLLVKQSGSDNSVICIQNGGEISGVTQTGGARAVVTTER